MFGFGRGRFPFLIPLVVLAAIVGYSLIGSAGAALGFVLLFPLKLLFFMFLFGMFFRFARGGAPWGGGGRRGSWDPPLQSSRAAPLPKKITDFFTPAPGAELETTRWAALFTVDV